MKTSHKHQWRQLMHLDGCHWYASSYTCDCGAARSSTGERDLANPSYWEPIDDCERCSQLVAGAKPQFTDEIVLP